MLSSTQHLLAKGRTMAKHNDHPVQGAVTPDHEAAAALSDDVKQQIKELHAEDDSLTADQISEALDGEDDGVTAGAVQAVLRGDAVAEAVEAIK
jgi:polyhydroxyalkanoate synthesis regulator phasin